MKTTLPEKYLKEEKRVREIKDQNVLREMILNFDDMTATAISTLTNRKYLVEIRDKSEHLSLRILADRRLDELGNSKDFIKN
ncbi:hypothetical protein N9948_00850 [bacterium]|nr:hypothetical protein [bacterium]